MYKQAFFKVTLCSMLLTAIWTYGLIAEDKPVPAPAQVIVTDQTWKASDKEAKGWTTDDFDDSGWSKADSPCDSRPDNNYDRLNLNNSFGFPTEAKWIWALSNKDVCFVRRHIKIEGELQRAEMVIVADDLAKLYINGLIIYEWDNVKTRCWAWKGCAAVLNILPFLQKGENIVAIEVINNGGPKGLGAEIRLNHTPILFKWLPKESGAIPADILEKMQLVAKKLGAEDWKEREQATEELMGMARKQGEKAIPFLKELLQNKDPEITLRARYILDTIFFQEPKDERATFTISDFKLSDLTDVLQEETNRCNLYRICYAIGKLINQDRQKTVEELIKQMDSSKKQISSRVIQLADLVETPELLPNIRESILKMELNMDLIWATAALAKMGTKSDIELLEKIAAKYEASKDYFGRAVLRTALWGILRIKSGSQPDK